MNKIKNDQADSKSSEPEFPETQKANPENENDQPETSNDTSSEKDPEAGKNPAIPEAAYRQLPQFLSKAVSYFENWYEKDVFLIGLLVVLSACMPKFRFRYKKGTHTPHFYAFVLAQAASGKGVLRHAFDLANGVNDLLLQESSDERRRWKEEKKTYDETKGTSSSDASTPTPTQPGPEPSERCLFAGEDITSAKLGMRLRDNKEGILMASTEADAVSQANRKEYGQFSHILRRAFHHERITVDRKGSGTLRVEYPKLALILSGTPDQIQGLIDNTQDGLYSRFAVYKFEAPLRYESQRPSKKDQAFIIFKINAKRQVVHLYKSLRSREKPLTFKVSNHLWDQVDHAFEDLFNRLFNEDKKVSPILAPVVKRGALITFRIAMVLSVIRHFEQGVDLSTVPRIEAGEADIKAAIALGLVFAEHGVRLPMATQPTYLEDVGGHNRMTGPQRLFFDALPTDFETSEAKTIAAEFNISRSTCFRRLEKLIDAGLLVKEKHGWYRKTMPDETSGTSGTTETA